ncbi:hypothetical protein [Heyndrickxia oleronia]|uniref:hypothetical protein n=1 Tax=Heyndrickxia oleronia TaxID=38875 RepID=UPI001C0EAA2C|nr:hypothetical protein [Heyndrickxia oleronia]MBU5212192.1 hypothetical protein [Heyndrickxia oleronia]
MFLSRKKRISELLETVSEMLGVLNNLQNPENAIYDCLAALEAISIQLNREEIKPKNTVEQLQIIEKSFKNLLSNDTLFNENFITDLNYQVFSLKVLFNEEVKTKLKVVFFPYKASMWDSLASVYESAVEDENCEARVVPIPYYQLSKNGAIPTYEGENFPADIPITHYSEYILEEEQPDIIFIHNIYDQYNTLTRVYEQYFTFNLKKYTDMLVYVPYYISSFISHKKGEGFYPYSNPSIKNIDKIILINDVEKEKAIREGISMDKILVAGSPKLDAMINALSKEIDYPMEWKEKISGKTVYLVDTGCLYFANQPFQALEHLIDIFNIPRFIENSIVIWRPHPLTKTSILKYVPFFFEYYQNLTRTSIKEDPLYKDIILDETDSYFPALVAADVIISKEGSLLNAYLLTEKKVLYWGENMPENSLLPPNVFYYVMDRSEPWFELVKKFSKGYDPLAENRKGIAKKLYINPDGTSGKKIYLAIKNEVLNITN